MLAIKRNILLSGVLLGVAYGLAAHFAFRERTALPTIAYLFMVPTAMGAVPLLFSDVDQITNYLAVLFLPWLVTFSLFVLFLALHLEAVLCLVILALPFLAAAMLGTLIAVIVRGLIIRSRKRKLAGAVMMLFPFFFLAIEKRFLVEPVARTVESSVVVDAPARVIWDHLAAFETIQTSEYHPGLFNRLGVPRPIRATVDKVALGGKRTGEFDNDLKFDEVITTFEAPVKLGFSIHVDPSTLRRDSTERHAFEHGYFRFVDAAYTLEPVGDRVKVHLTSTYVMTTSVNWYGDLWARAVVGDFQDRVLQVLRARVEPREHEHPAEVAAASHDAAEE